MIIFLPSTDIGIGERAEHLRFVQIKTGSSFFT